MFYFCQAASELAMGAKQIQSTVNEEGQRTFEKLRTVVGDQDSEEFEGLEQLADKVVINYEML